MDNIVAASFYRFNRLTPNANARTFSQIAFTKDIAQFHAGSPHVRYPCPR